MDKVLPFFSFEGRTNRSLYWLTTLVIYGLLLVTVVIGMVVPVVGPVLIVVGFIAALWIGFATAARRLHDRNKSAWWLVPMYVPVLLLSVLGQLMSVSNPDAGAAVNVLTLPFSLWLLIELGCLRGTAGANRFGPDPLAPSPAEVFA